MSNFKLFLEAEDIDKLPNAIVWIKDFFNHGLDTTTLKVWGDWLEENGYAPTAELFHTIGDKFRNPKLKKGSWGGRLVGLFYDVFGFHPEYVRQYDMNDKMTGSWFFHESGGHQMARHIVHPEHTSYRLSLTNGKWFSYTNTGNSRVSVVSTRHTPTEDSERWYPADRISLRDYKPIDVNSLPEDLVLCAFYKLMEKQVRGGH